MSLLSILPPHSFHPLHSGTMEPKAKRQKMSVFEKAVAEAELETFVAWHFLKPDCSNHMEQMAKDVQKESWAKYAFAPGVGDTAEECYPNTAHRTQQAIHPLRAAYTSAGLAMNSVCERVKMNWDGCQANDGKTHLFRKAIIQVARASTNILDDIEQYIDESREDFALGPAGKDYVGDVDIMTLIWGATRTYSILLRHELVLSCLPWWKIDISFREPGISHLSAQF